MILNSFNLEGKIALVTGASTGIGAAIAVGLAEAGAHVACHGNSHSPDETCLLVRNLGKKTLALQGDLQDRSVPAKLVEKTVKELGPVDILVNNAGLIRRAPAAEYSDEDWLTVIEVNLNSVFRLSQEVGKRMIASKQGGKIINIASLLTFQGGITVPAYAASKGGVGQLTKALANEWAQYGIQVNAIAPGYIETDNTKALRENPKRFAEISSRIPAARWGTPQDLVGASVFLSSPASNYISGHILVVDGGWMAR
ncbi:MAG: 2-dehydro-3-deoxy-D-gluconate 5-dehydrogenase KduD [Bacteroidota bacterium]